MEYEKTKRRHKVVMFFLVSIVFLSMFTGFGLIRFVRAADFYGVNISCYNETNVSQTINFDIFFTNLTGTETYDNTSMPTPSFFNYTIPNFPTNCYVRVKASNTSYAPRTITTYMDPTENKTLIYYMPPFSDTELYYIRVIDVLYEPIDDVTVNISKFIDGSYRLIGSKFTDPDGRASYYLIPNDEYRVTISKEGYHSKTETFTADPTDFGYNYPRTYFLRISNITQVNTSDLYRNIDWSLEPEKRYYESDEEIKVFFNITSSDSQLTSFALKAYYYDEGEWTEEYNEVNYTTSGGSLNCTIGDQEGRFKVEAYFTKIGFPEVEVSEEGSRIYFFGNLSVWFPELYENIPNWIMVVVLLVVAAAIMAFMFPFAGMGTGYVGLGILAFGFSLPMFEGIQMGGVGIWPILAISAFMYTMGLLLWSKI